MFIKYKEKTVGLLSDNSWSEMCFSLYVHDVNSLMKPCSCLSLSRPPAFDRSVSAASAKCQAAQ